MTLQHILLFDPGLQKATVLAAGLAAGGIACESAKHTASALASCNTGKITAALLFLDNETADGLTLLEQLRTNRPALPVMVVTPADAVELRVSALQQGAADYLILPFTTAYLIQRLGTAQARMQTAATRLLQLGKLVLDTQTGQLGDGERWIHLTPAERMVFRQMLEHSDQPVSKQRIKQLLATSSPVSDNAVEVVIYRLRAKLHSWDMNIRTFRSIGYVLEHQP